MIYSGVDWSGNSDDALLVIAMVHIEGGDISELDRELDLTRKNLGRDSTYVFKHLAAKRNTHGVFYQAIRRIESFQAHVLMMNRRAWNLSASKPSHGDHYVCDGIVAMAKACPAHLVDGQMLYLDLPREEKRIVDAIRTEVRKAMRSSRQGSFKDIRPRPDSRSDGAIVQVADMIAGEVREYAGIGGRYLPSLGSRITMI